MPPPADEKVILIRSDDPILRAEAVRAAVTEAAAGEDLSFGLEDFDGDEYDLVSVVTAAQTPPTFTSRRIVVARDVGRFNTEAVAPLLAYIPQPSPTTVLILVGGGGTIARKLLDTVKKWGEIVDAGVPSGKARQQWLADRLKAAPVRLDTRATARMADHLGDDLSRLGGIVSVLAEVFGEGARITESDLEPFLGDAGSGAPWDLTDAIDRGDVPAALDQLRRQIGAGDRHPLQILASLHAHFTRMLRLDGAGARDEAEAASMLGMTGSTFPARKALAQTRKLGSANVARSIELIADADLDLKGQRDIPGSLVMEILVARLARLAASAAASPRRRGA